MEPRNFSSERWGEIAVPVEAQLHPVLPVLIQHGGLDAYGLAGVRRHGSGSQPYSKEDTQQDHMGLVE